MASGMSWNGTGYLEMCVIATSQRGFFFFFFFKIDSFFFFFNDSSSFPISMYGRY